MRMRFVIILLLAAWTAGATQAQITSNPIPEPIEKRLRGEVNKFLQARARAAKPEEGAKARTELLQALTGPPESNARVIWEVLTDELGRPKQDDVKEFDLLLREVLKSSPGFAELLAVQQALKLPWRRAGDKGMTPAGREKGRPPGAGPNHDGARARGWRWPPARPTAPGRAPSPPC